MLIFLSILATIILLTLIIGKALSVKGYQGPVSDHFDGKKFINPDGIKASGMKEAFKMLGKEKRGKWQEIKEIETTKPTERVDIGILNLVFINHSSFLIQVDGLNILTDPIFSDRVSPFSWMGPKRMTPPGLKIEELPPIDILLLSHNHYDHLDIPAWKKLVPQHQPAIYTTLGNQHFLNSHGFPKVTEMDWWDTLTINENLKIHCVPAQHFSSRGLFDRDTTLWGGFIIETTWGKIYFAGDSGYNTFFKEIGEKHGPLDLSLIPIGAYKPRYFMSPIHIGPQEAVMVHKDVQSRQSVGTHFGTFNLAFEGMEEPIETLKEELQSQQVTENEFITLKVGEHKTFPSFPA